MFEKIATKGFKKFSQSESHHVRLNEKLGVLSRSRRDREHPEAPHVTFQLEEIAGSKDMTDGRAAEKQETTQLKRLLVFVWNTAMNTGVSTGPLTVCCHRGKTRTRTKTCRDELKVRANSIQWMDG